MTIRIKLGRSEADVTSDGWTACEPSDDRQFSPDAERQISESLSGVSSLNDPYTVTLPTDNGAVRHVSYWHEPEGQPLTVLEAHDLGIAAQLEAHARGVPWAATEGDER